MHDCDAIDAAGLITSQIAGNRLLDSLHDLRQRKREAVAAHAAQSQTFELHQEILELTDRLNQLVDSYNGLLAAHCVAQKQLSELKVNAERQREKIDEGRCHIDTLRELADAYHDEILRLDPNSPL